MMIMSHIFCDLYKIRILNLADNGMQKPCPFRCMLFHLFKFTRRKPSRFLQNIIIDCNLADIMKRRRLDHGLAIFRSENAIPFIPAHQFLGQDLHAHAGTFDMAAGGVVAVFNHVRHAQEHPILHLFQMPGLPLHVALQFFVITCHLALILAFIRGIHQLHVIAEMMTLFILQIINRNLVFPSLLIDVVHCLIERIVQLRHQLKEPDKEGIVLRQ